MDLAEIRHWAIVVVYAGAVAAWLMFWAWVLTHPDRADYEPPETDEHGRIPGDW